MVVALKPGKFYGNSLPRPRFYTDVKLNTERVDPPLPVLDPLLSWANDAHWSMGGLSFKRHRLQGKIEGRIQNLRVALDDDDGDRAAPKRKKMKPAPTRVLRESTRQNSRQRLAAALDSSSESEEGGEAEQEINVGSSSVGVGGDLKRRSARKLSDEFDKVAASASASPKGDGDGKRKASAKVADGNGRISPSSKKASLRERMTAVASLVRNPTSETKREMSRTDTKKSGKVKGSSKKKSPNKRK